MTLLQEKSLADRLCWFNLLGRALLNYQRNICEFGIEHNGVYWYTGSIIATISYLFSSWFSLCRAWQPDDRAELILLVSFIVIDHWNFSQRKVFQLLHCDWSLQHLQSNFHKGVETDSLWLIIEIFAIKFSQRGWNCFIVIDHWNVCNQLFTKGLKLLHCDWSLKCL